LSWRTQPCTCAFGIDGFRSGRCVLVDDWTSCALLSDPQSPRSHAGWYSRTGKTAWTSGRAARLLPGARIHGARRSILARLAARDLGILFFGLGKQTRHLFGDLGPHLGCCKKFLALLRISGLVRPSFRVRSLHPEMGNGSWHAPTGRRPRRHLQCTIAQMVKVRI
jgi:hypothetical protein